MTKIIRSFPSVLLLVALLMTGIAQAAAAQSYLRSKQKELTVLIKKPSSSSVDKKLSNTFDQLLDYGAFAEKSLATEWSQRSAEERAEFQSLLTTLVRRSYTKNLRDTLDYEIEFKGEEQAKKGQLVRSVAKHKTDARKETVHIDYLVHKVGGNWRVYDIITEGESLVGNYTNQFRRVIKKNGFSGLLDKMRKKVKQG